ASSAAGPEDRIRARGLVALIARDTGKAGADVRAAGPGPRVGRAAAVLLLRDRAVVVEQVAAVGLVGRHGIRLLDVRALPRHGAGLGRRGGLETQGGHRAAEGGNGRLAE